MLKARPSLGLSWLLPPAVLLFLIATHAVNVPRWDDWDVIPFVLRAHEGSLGFADFWAQHNEHRLAAVKLILAPLAVATDFDVTAMMYAGFALQFLALAFLSLVVRRTIGRDDPWLAAAVAFAIALAMFSPAQDEVWLWGLPSLQWHLCNLTAAAGVWVAARWSRPLLWLPAVFVLASAGMLAVASGVVLWGVALFVILTQDMVARRRPAWPVLTGWAAGGLAMVGAYFAGFHPSGTARDPLYALHHPLAFGDFVLVYLGSPFVRNGSLGAARVCGVVGLAAFAGALYAAVIRRFLAERILPWLWLSSYAFLVALATAVGRTETGTIVAMTNRYTTGSVFFSIGLLVIAVLTFRHVIRESPPPVARTLRFVAAALVIVAGVNHARLYRAGYRRFVQTHEDRRTVLAELQRYETAPDDALTFLYPPSADQVRHYARILEQRRLGPFSERMIRRREEIAQALVEAGPIGAGDGTLHPTQCMMITGWAWDRRQPDATVNVDLYDGNERLATVPAYWYRRDLDVNGIGTGRHAYFYSPPARLKDGQARIIRARIAGMTADLPGSPRTFVCSDPQAVPWR